MRLAALALLLPLSLACNEPPVESSRGSTTGSTPPPVAVGVPVYSYDIVNTFPHDSKAYTQGLVYIPDGFYESTGQYGESDLRKVGLKDGKPSKLVPIEPEYFAEGLALLNNKLYQLTWQAGKGFIYAADTFKREGTFAYEGEGWGLATDGKTLILSDGSHRIRFIDPKTFKVDRSIEVYDENRKDFPLVNLNELELIKGEIWANVWQSDMIVRIDPKDGKLLGKIDLTGLPAGQNPGDNDNVLNGIAYDEKGDRIFVTGKRWPKLFEIKIKPKS